MVEIRIAKQTDKNEYYRLWKTCFGDSDAFCDWFFENRFSPEHSVILESEGEIVSCMQAFPYTILIRGKEIKGAMLCGVSTHPEHRKKGYMGKIFTYEMNHLKNMGYLVAVHTPAVLPSYFSYGHYPVADAKYLECDYVPSFESKIKLELCEKEIWKELHLIYSIFAEKYSGIIKRSEEDFIRKAADYAADGGKCSVYKVDNKVKGYAFYYQTEETLLCVEAAAEEGNYHALMEGLLAQAKGLRFSAKLPPELYLYFPHTKLTRKQKGVMGLCNASALLKHLQLEIPYGFRLYDPVIKENNGNFDFNGNAYTDIPVFDISAEHLLQVLVGYHSLNELRNKLNIADELKFAEINSFLPKQKCYIIDEY